MKTLQTIQKTFHVIQILTKIAHVFCIIGAVLSGVGAAYAMASYTGTQMFLVFGEPVKFFSEETNLLQEFAWLLSVTFPLMGAAVLLDLTHRYLRFEQAEGTPFTLAGAERLKKLGIRYIYIPILAVIASRIIPVYLGVRTVEEAAGFGSILPGLLLLLVSLIFRYGAELEKK